MNSKISAIGVYTPENVIPNTWFENIINTNDEWIQSRTGIKERRVASKYEYTSELAVKAVQNLLKENHGTSLEGIDFIIVATTTADQIMPNTASQVQHKLNITNAGCIDVMAACAGFVYAMILAKGLIAAKTHKKILVIGAETLSKFTDYTDRSSCILFGDGAGVVLIEPSSDAKIFNGITGTDGSHGKDLYLSHGNSIINNEEIIANGKIHQNGKVVFKWAVQNMVFKVKELLERNNLKLGDLDWLILHSANMRIIEAVAAALDYPLSKMLTSIEQYGNTSAASIPIAWDLGIKAGKVKKGNKLLLLGFGGGLTFAGIIIEV
ncbi:MAG: ketoacyl-ACP synthase III [Cytophagaceae bacterium]|nr:ketoacyl-ACP synthase III [Cytophagaceae bacterium]